MIHIKDLKIGKHLIFRGSDVLIYENHHYHNEKFIFTIKNVIDNKIDVIYDYDGITSIFNEKDFIDFNIIEYP